MLKTIFLTALTLAIALGGGAGSVWLALERNFGFGTVSIGGWTAYPLRGTASADPYTKARFSREADLAIGQAEGLTFFATRDAAGDTLRFECDYRLEGSLPPARFWTLHVRDSDGAVSRPDGDRADALHSYALLREEDNAVTTTVSRFPAPGNWLATKGTGDLLLVLTLYDTSIASSARIEEVELPRVVPQGCQ